MFALVRFTAICLAASASFAAVAAPAPAQNPHFDSDTGMRISRYRAPTPDTVAGGTRIDIDELDRLVKDDGAVLLDVMVAEGAGPHPKTGVWHLYNPRKSLPGAHWLADVGKGKLTPELKRYFKTNLEDLTGGDKTYPIIVFCMADCWMSWNAVKRAAQWGYTNVYWYPDGTDGWRDWDRTFVTAVPRPLKTKRIAEATTTATDATAATLPSGTKSVSLIAHDGTRLKIATVSFKPSDERGYIGFDVKLLDAEFQDEFLSMRPFRCMPDKKEMWCHLAYPYETKKKISKADLQDLEYALLFLFKPPKGYGIDAWNGLYFKLKLEGDGNITGTLHETDMNVLAIPPDAGELRPISHGALSEVEPDAHRFYKIEIK